MSNLTVIGTQWGDEGKGKIVDWLASKADAVVRFHGGHNAGHTLVVGDKVYKLSLLPSGVVQGKLGIIGNGVVVDPKALFEEIKAVRAQGVRVDADHLKIAENAPLILPVHAALDRARESLNDGHKIGTTCRGIGPAYEDKVGRRAVRLCDLQDFTSLKSKVEKLLSHHNILLKGLGVETYSVDQIMSYLKEMAPHILPYKAFTWEIISKLQQEKKNILFEGAQAVMLDVDHGTYPYVTSSNTVSSNVGVGIGAGSRINGHVLGIAKAYCTRVGEGPFPTELHDKVGNEIADRGHEYGTNTGRKRRCGWLDVALLRYAMTVGGVDSVALTKMDVLDHLDEIKIAVGYEIDGKKCRNLPYAQEAQAKVRPIYETLPGWHENTHGICKMEDLPKKAQAYIHRIEELCNVPVSIISTSPNREDTICRNEELMG